MQRQKIKSYSLYKILLIVLFLFLGGFIWVISQPSTAIYNFRTTTNSLKSSRYHPSTYGLNSLNASASGHLSEAKIVKNLTHFKVPIYVIDVRLEQDYFYRGIPVGWLGIKEQNGYPIDILKQTFWYEKPWHVFKWSIRRFVNFRNTSIDLNQLTTEADFLKNFNIHYFSCGSKRHHVHNDELIEKFIQFLDGLPQDAWLHFHCATGRGRSTTFMVLYDIYKNHKKVILEDIILRQHLLGGENILDIALRPKGTWTKTDLLKRKALAYDFYQYMNDPNGYGVNSWSKWKQSHYTNVDNER